MSNPKCEECGKTAYPLESFQSAGKSWHKGCFRCAEPTCKQVLNQKTVNAANGTIYCSAHYPKEKATAVVDSLSMVNATNSPKVALVNNQKRGDGMETNAQSSDTMQLNLARNAPKVDRLPPHQRDDQHVKPIGTLDMAHMNAMNAPKLNTVNDQVKNVDVPTSTINVTLQNALNAPKLDTVNDQVKNVDVPTSTINITLQNALNAPKLDTVNNEVKAIDRNI
ncbi:hypothetical protein DLAC_04516 [Tieghemostelium lacteum]|uniref:LIM zinc-binding domain-containing protein n=1 Tax=Tieghemostelium lacteum TaxID=361077 RepID=A0A151ZJP3_TIELA|nr:hypothetical protein DLAC_04516 [Tieghemostelium lacteum]|eukprot:KYQ94221.1 hypothetical protein DLAC_04516 [Tieghemostelium lacteum]